MVSNFDHNDAKDAMLIFQFKEFSLDKQMNCVNESNKYFRILVQFSVIAYQSITYIYSDT